MAWKKVSSDLGGKRHVLFCDRCRRLMTVSSEALEVGVTCPCSPLTADQNAALAQENSERRRKGDRGDWRPQR